MAFVVFFKPDLPNTGLHCNTILFLPFKNMYAMNLKLNTNYYVLPRKRLTI